MVYRCQKIYVIYIFTINFLILNLCFVNVKCCIPTKPGENVHIPSKKPNGQSKITTPSQVTTTVGPTTTKQFTTQAKSSTITTTTPEKKCLQCKVDDLDKNPKEGYSLPTEIGELETTDDGCTAVIIICNESTECSNELYYVYANGEYDLGLRGFSAGRRFFCDSDGTWNADEFEKKYVSAIYCKVTDRC